MLGNAKRLLALGGVALVLLIGAGVYFGGSYVRGLREDRAALEQRVAELGLALNQREQALSRALDEQNAARRAREAAERALRSALTTDPAGQEWGRQRLPDSVLEALK